MTQLTDQINLYNQIGFGARVGFGRKSALLIIDNMRGITEPLSPMHIAMDEEIMKTMQLVKLFRNVSLPIFHVRSFYQPPHFIDGGVFIHKGKEFFSKLTEGSELTEFDHRLTPMPEDTIVVKKFPSAFFGTPLQTFLTGLLVDTVVVVGNSTSGCIRATCLDACCHGFKVIVPKDCVADRADLSHVVNLFDIDSKIGDVVNSEDVINHIRGNIDSSKKYT